MFNFEFLMGNKKWLEDFESRITSYFKQKVIQPVPSFSSGEIGGLIKGLGR